MPCKSAKDNSTAPNVMSCPANGARSRRVSPLTVKSLVRRLSLGVPETQYYFCRAANCEVVYFPLDAKAPTFYREDLLVRVDTKEAPGPGTVCYCFGVTRKDIQDEINQNEIGETGQSRLVERIAAEVEAGRCACEVKNPSGKCCLGEISQIARMQR